MSKSPQPRTALNAKTAERLAAGKNADAHKSSAARDDLLRGMADQIARSLDPYLILDTVRTACRNAMRSDFSAIALNDDRNGEFVWASQDLTSLNIDIEPEIFAFCRRILGRGEGATTEIRSNESIFSCVGVPILIDKRPAGVIALLKRRHAFPPEDRQWLKEAALVAGGALERAKSHRSLVDRCRNLATILDAMECGVMGISSSKTIVFANRATDGILDIRSERLLGKEFANILPPRLSSMVGAFFASARKDLPQPIRQELKYATEAGLNLHLEVTLTPWTGEEGPFVGVIVTIADATSRQVSQERFQQMERLMSIGQTVAGVAHELNNPLSTIYGYAQILFDQCKDPAIKKQLSVLCDEAKRSAAIVRNLLTFSREHKLEKREVNVNDVIQRVVNFRAYELRANKIEIVADLDPSVHSTMADERQIEQVLINLINNAEDAMIDARGKGRMTVASRLIEGGTRIRIEVADDGPGIPEEHLPRIFDPFYTTKPEGKGTGLGLSICFGIVREHGGQIWAESPGKGALFVIELPVAKGVSKKATTVRRTAGERAASSFTPTDLRGKRALVVDDEPNIIDLLLELLNREGMTVEAAANGVVALTKIEHGTYDVVLSDIKMPALDGRELMERIRTKRPAMSRRVLYMTGSILSEETKRFINDVGADYIQKPFDLDEIVAKIRRRIEDPS